MCCDTLETGADLLGPSAALYLVADGHSGAKCAQYIAAHLKNHFLGHLKELNGDVRQSLFQTMKSLETRLASESEG